jgi:Ca2+-binding RTX toxin-like protein
LTSIRDHVYDVSRDILFIATNTGKVERYDVATQQLLQTWNVGTDLGAIDITPDGAFLYATELTEIMDESIVYKIGADSGLVTTLSIPTPGSQSGFFDVAVAGNGKALVTGRFSGSGSVAIQELDTTTDMFTTGMTVQQDTRVSRSANYATLFFTQANISSGPVNIYDSASGTFTIGFSTFTSVGDAHTAVSPDGTQIAIEDNSYIGLSILNTALDTEAILPPIRGGVAYDPTGRVFVAGDSANDQLVGFDTTTFEEVFRVDYGLDLGTSFAPMSASAEHVFATVPAQGLQVFDLGTFAGFDAIEVGTQDAVTGIDFGNAPNQPTLYVVSSDTEILETDGAMASTITVVRAGGDLNMPLTISLASSDPLAAGTVSIILLLAGEFSQTVDVAAIDDTFVDGTQTTTITASANGFVSDAISIDVLDDEVAGFAVTISWLDTQVSEPSGTDTFEVVLTGRPLTDVVFDLVFDDGSRVSSDQSMLTFNSTDWNIPQVVTLTAIDNFRIDGTANPIMSVAILDAQADDFFDTLETQTVDITVFNEDVAGLIVIESGGTTDVNEFGTDDTFTVELTAEPDTEVVVSVVSGDPNQVSVDVIELSFDSSNWNMPQTVTVGGIPDLVPEEPQTYPVTMSIVDDRSDNNFDSVTDEVVTVNVADLPSIDVIDDIEIGEDSGTANVGLTGISSGGSNQDIRVTAEVTDNLALINSVTVVHANGMDPTASLLFAPSTDVFGEAEITVTVESPGVDDDFDLTDDNLIFSRSFIVTVTPVNDAPALSALAVVNVAEDGQFVFPAIGGISVLDVDAADMKASLSVSNGTLTLPANTIGVTILEGTGTQDKSLVIVGLQAVVNKAFRGLIYEPDPNFFGNDTLSIQVDDQGSTGAGGPLTDSTTIAITVDPVDDIPVNTVPGAQQLAEDVSIEFSSANQNGFSIEDVDAVSPLDITVTATNGTISLGDLTGINLVIGTGSNDTMVVFQGSVSDVNNSLDGLTFTPAANQIGAASISINTNDPSVGMAATDTDTVSITLTAVNDSPMNTVPGPVSTLEDTTLTFSAGNSNGLSISDAIDGDQGTMQVDLSVTTGLLTLSGELGLTFLQGSLSNDVMQFTGSVSDINAALEGMTYTPPSQFAGAVTLRLAMSDRGNTGAGVALSDVDDVTITVTAVDDPPIGSPETYLLLAGTTLTADDPNGTVPGPNDNGVLVNDLDLDSPNLSALMGSTPGAAASFSIASDGSFSYEHDGSSSVSESFTYQVTDGTTPSGPITVTLLINQPPVLTGGAFSVNENSTSATIVGQVTSTDPNANDAPIFSIISGDIDGAFSINPLTGLITVGDSSLLDFEATPTFNLIVQVEDSAPTSVRASDTATVTVSLTDLVEPLLIGPADWQADGLSVIRDGDSVRVIRTGTSLDVVPSQAIAQTSNISIVGRAGLTDRLTIDFSGGSPLVGTFDFDGGVGGMDSLTLTSGMFDSIVHNFASSSSGSVDLIDSLGTNSISYVGLEPIFDSLDATDRVFNFGATDDVVQLSASPAVNDRESILSSVSSSETVQFKNPSGTMTINLGDGNDQLLVDSTEAELSAAIIINGGMGNDQIDATGLTVPGTINGGDGDDVLTGGTAADVINGGKNADTIKGAGGNDLLIGSEGNDKISGDDGNDTLLGQGGSDDLDGGDGDDIVRGNGGSGDFLRGGNGDDLLDGGKGGGDRILEDITGDLTVTTNSMIGIGNDAINNVEGISIGGNDQANVIDLSAFRPPNLLGSTVVANGGDDQIIGTEGTDLLFGGSGNDVIFGNAGTDFLRGAAGADQLYGGDGDDNLRGQGGDNDQLNGGEGADVLDGGAGSDRMFETGGSFAFFGDFLVSENGTDRVTSVESIKLTGNDEDNLINVADYTGGVVEIHGEGGADTITGSNQADVIFGGSGDDFIQSLGGDDIIIGGDGDDVIIAGDGNDFVHGVNGDDTVYGGNGDDFLIGGAGNDGLSGGAGNDNLNGKSGEDTLLGNGGDDIINGGTFRDSLVGGEGSDIINGEGHTQDEIAGGSGAGPDAGDQVIGNASEVDEFFILTDLAPWFDDSLNA